MHVPVLLNEVVSYLSPIPGQKLIDATINGGGHALALLERIVPGGKLLGIEWDAILLDKLRIKTESHESKNNLILINDSYVNLQKIADENGFNNADGILFDLGMSSWHIEESGRGFTFQKDEPLNMRFGSYPNIEQDSLTAEKIINKYTESELTTIFKEYGGERFAKLIAIAIIKARKQRLIKSTLQLVEIIKETVPFWYKRRKIHFATKTFQALRIAVNRELENLTEGLGQAINILKSGGRLTVITFHSLEDRIVKNFFKEKNKEKIIVLITKKPVKPTFEETKQNRRSRSAKLRVVEKI